MLIMTKPVELKNIGELVANPSLSFYSGDISNKRGVREFIKQVRRGGKVEIHTGAMSYTIEELLKKGNVFGAMCVMQFSFMWQKEFRDINVLNMGQVDQLLRKYF